MPATSPDHAEPIDRRSHKLEVVTAFCALQPPLFAGIDLTDDTPNGLHGFWQHTTTGVRSDQHARNTRPAHPRIRFCPLHG